VSIGDEAAEQRFARLAEQNGMSPEAFAEALRSGNVDPAELRDRLKAQLLWQRYVSQRLQQRLQITEEQVNEYLEELEENRGEPEYRVAEIFLAAEDGEARRDARGLARRLTTELRQGAEFAALARQFSDSAGGQGGGEMGWVQPGQLDPALEEALRALSVGEVSDPIAAGGGVHILKLLDRRRILTADPAEIQVSLKQLVLSPSAPPAEEVRARIESCTQMDQVIERFGQPGSGNLGTLTLGDVPADLREALLEVQDGEVSRAIEWRGEPTLFMVCERNSPDVSLPSREEVRNRLANQRFTLLSRRLMRDLRESAYVEVRTG
jgi:peptidyl-prolyl cis-trans isomerase SurA